jgi:NADH:ubiquinone oxidoreductase subunit 5 (subunit L)/multisubunit Na+/H+ antiporter MnhA subunit
VTFAVWVVGVFALVGLWPLSGFFSKDAILDAVWIAVPIAGVLLFATAFITGVYSGRATRLTFFGSRRGSDHAHESPLSMLIPLVVLAVPAALLGFAGDWIFTRLGQHPEPLSLSVTGRTLMRLCRCASVDSGRQAPSASAGTDWSCARWSFLSLSRAESCGRSWIAT